MAAGNEGNNFVRDGSMLPHHTIDTSTTPNSWKPKVDFDTEPNIDLGGDPAKGVSSKELYDWMAHYTLDDYQAGPLAVPSAVGTVLWSINVPEAGLWFFNWQARDEIGTPTNRRGHGGFLYTGGFAGVQSFPERDTDPTSEPYGNGMMIKELNQGDLVRFFIRQESGAPREYNGLRIMMARMPRKD